MIVATLALAGPARGQGLSGSLQILFRWAEGEGRRVEQWSRTVQINHRARLGPDIDLTSQFRYNDDRIVGQPDKSRVPQGLMRLSHRLFGLSASHRPQTIVDRLGVTTRTSESVLAGYLAAQRLPRLDLTWVRRERRADVTHVPVGGVTDTRSARLAHQLGPFQVRGGYGDVAEDGGDPSGRRVIQRTYDAGAGLRVQPWRALSMRLDYDFGHTWRGRVAATATRTTSHSVSATTTFQQTRRAAWSLRYGFRDSEVGAITRERSQYRDGLLSFGYAAPGGVQFSIGGGARTTSSGADQRLLRLVNAQVTWNGKVREGWEGSGTAARSASWFPGGRRFTSDSYRLGSRFRLARGLDLAADVQVTASGDTAARNQRYGSQASLGLSASPLRSVSFTYTDQRLRYGSSLFDASAHSQSRLWAVFWRPRAGLDVSGAWSSSGALPRNDQRSTTRNLNLNWTPGTLLQLNVNYATSNQASLQGGTSQISGSEIVGIRALVGLSRTFRASVGFDVADPNRPTERRQFDASLTKTFRRY